LLRGLPSVVSGKNHTISYPTGVATLSIPFDTDWGSICVDASIKEAAGGVARSRHDLRKLSTLVAREET